MKISTAFILLLALAVCRAETDRVENMVLRLLTDMGAIMEDVKHLIHLTEQDHIKPTGVGITKGQCEVELQGWGMSELNQGFIKVNGEMVEDLSWKPRGSPRGLNVVLARRTKDGGCAVIENSYRHYDTFDSPERTEQFVEYISSQPAGTLLLVATADEATGNKKYPEVGTHLDAAQPLFEDLGVTLPGLDFRGSFVFVAMKGSKSHTVRDVKPNEKGYARLHVVL